MGENKGAGTRASDRITGLTGSPSPPGHANGYLRHIADPAMGRLQHKTLARELGPRRKTYVRPSSRAHRHLKTRSLTTTALFVVWHETPALWNAKYRRRKSRARVGLIRFVQDYNLVRPHGTLKGLTPMEAYVHPEVKPDFRKPVQEMRGIRLEENRKVNCGDCMKG